MGNDSEGLEAEGNNWRTGIRRKGDARGLESHRGKKETNVDPIAF